MKKTLLMISIIITGCGGGNETPTTPAVVSTLAFPLAVAYKNRVTMGSNDSFTLSNATGSCTGTGSLTTSAPVAATFYGVSGLSATQTLNVTTSGYTNCAGNNTAYIYFDSNYDYLGFSSPSINQYGLVKSTTPIQTTVRVGDSGQFASPQITKHNSYGDYGVYGEQQITYLIEADTESTALVNLISKTYSWECINRIDCLNTLVSTQQERYRITADGALTLVTIDFMNHTNNTQLIFTKI